MRRFSIAVVLSLYSVGLMAQEEPNPSGEIEDVEIVIEKEKKLTLPQARRIFRQSKVQSSGAQALKLNYSILAPTFKLPGYNPQFQAVDLEPKKEEEDKYNNLVRAGFGNFTSPLFEFYHSQKLEKGRFGASFRHESFGNGPVRDENSGEIENTVQLFGGIEGRKSSLLGALSYSRNDYFFYGLTDSAFASGNESFIVDRVNLQRFGFNASWKIKNEADKPSLNLRPSFFLTTNGENGEPSFADETLFRLDGNFGIPLKDDQKVGVDFRSNFSSYESGESQSRNLISFDPYYKTKFNDIEIKIGANINIFQDQASSSESAINGLVDIKVPLNKYYVRAGLDSRPVFNSLTEVSQTNTFLDDSLDLRTSIIATPVFAKIGGVPFKNFEFEASAYLRNVENAAFFVPGQSDSSRYILTYDEGELGIIEFQLNGKYYLDPSFHISGNLKYRSFDTDQISNAWHLPEGEITLSLTKSFDQKFFIQGNLNVIGGMVAPQGDLSVDLDEIVDLSIISNYKINDRTQVFLNLNNLLDNSYERFLYYPSRSIAVKAGVQFKF